MSNVIAGLVRRISKIIKQTKKNLLFSMVCCYQVEFPSGAQFLVLVKSKLYRRKKLLVFRG